MQMDVLKSMGVPGGEGGGISIKPWQSPHVHLKSGQSGLSDL